jgi:hypothetical protein
MQATSSWVARHGRYAIRIDANRPGVYHWLITLEGRRARRGTAPIVASDTLDELPARRSSV